MGDFTTGSETNGGGIRQQHTSSNPFDGESPHVNWGVTTGSAPTFSPVSPDESVGTTQRPEIPPSNPQHFDPALDKPMPRSEEPAPAVRADVADGDGDTYHEPPDEPENDGYGGPPVGHWSEDHNSAWMGPRRG